MPSHEECHSIKLDHVKVVGRVDAISERLDEVLEEVKAIKQWFVKYGTIAFIFAVAGDKAVPIVLKILGVK